MKNLLNLRWLHGSPNQTGETLTRENRLGIVTCLNPLRTLLITLLLLTLGVGQMWAATDKWNVYMTGSGSNPGKGSLIASFTSGNDVTWISTTNDAKRFYLNWGEQDNNNWFNGTSWSGPASAQQLYKYGDNNYEHGMNLTPVLGGVYRFSTWDDNGRWFQYQPFIIVGDGSENWLGGYSWQNTNVANIAKSTGVTYSNCAAGEKNFRIVAYGEWDQSHGFSQTTSDFPISDGGDNNVQFTTGANATITISFDGDDISLSVAYPIIYKDQGDEAFSGSHGVGYPTSHTYGSATALDNPTKNYYDFAGWYTTSSCSGEAITSLSSDGYNATITLYAKWTPKSYSITYKDQGGSDYSGSNEGSLPSSYTYGTGIATLTSGVKSGYNFMGWYEDSGCTGSSITTIATTATGDKTFYAKWEEITGGSVQVSAGTGGQVSKDNSSWGTSATITDITSAQNVNIYARANTGYTFNTWTKNTGTGSITTNAATGVYAAIAYEAAELTASFNEKMSTLTTSNSYDAGDPGYAIPAVSGSATNVGYVTTRTITAAAAGTGYMLGSWTITNGTRTDGGAANATTITVRSNGDGSAVSVVANYVEDLSTGWYLATDAFDAGTWVSEKTEFLKRAGESTGSIAYVSYDLDRTGSYPTNNQFRFKIQDANTDHTYGDNNAGTMSYGNSTDWSLVDASLKDVTKVNVNVTGTYTFRLDYENMKISVIYPEINQLQVYTTTGTDGATIIQDYNWTQTTGIYSQDLTLQAGKTYTFKVVYNSTHYGKSTTLNASNKSATLSTSGGNVSLTTSVAGTYKISFNPSSNELSVSLNGETLTGVSVEYGRNLSTIVSVGDFTHPTITATIPLGLNFSGWTTTGAIELGSTSASETTITSASSGATVKANFTTEGIIYFDNTMSQWNGDIYVYLYTNSSPNPWWGSMDGSGNGPGVVIKKKDGTVLYNKGGKMTRIGESNIYYYDYKSAGLTGTIYHVVFTRGYQSNSAGLYRTDAAFRSDFNACLPCYIACTSSRSTPTNETGYYNAGYWKKWGDTHSGFTLYITDGGSGEKSCEFTSVDPSSSVYIAQIDLSTATSDLSYNVYRCSGGNKLRRAQYSGHIQYNDSDVPHELSDGDNASGILTTTSAGIYTFTLSLATDHIYMTTEYPLNIGDYRVVLNNGTKDHEAGRIIRAKDAALKDTVSFFIDKTKTNKIYVDSCFAVSPITWKRINDVDAAKLTVPTSAPYNKNGVYNFGITRTRHKDVSLSLLEEPEYEGNFYIRTDASDGEWTAYKTTEDNIMHYSFQSLSTAANYDYYYTKWTNKDQNMHFTIANDYSPCISDTLTSDATYLSGSGKDQLPTDANVRFTWNSNTNTLSRAFISGSSYRTRYLVFTGDEKIFDLDDNPIAADVEKNLNANELEFTDKGNWVYQIDLRAKSGAEVDVTAAYNGHTQSFINDQVLITTTDANSYKIRAVYDFKTNILIAAWLPDNEEITNNMKVEADIMLIRSGQKAANQIRFNSSGKITGVQKIVGAIEFCKDSIVGRVGSFSEDNPAAGGNRTYREMMMYISFPFDVAVQDIFGAGQFNKEWYLQYYDGAERAEKGFFRGDGTTTFWKFMNFTDTLRANVGYSLLLDNDYFNTDNYGIWANIPEHGSVYLYFPSAKELDGKVIKSETASITVPSHECKIDREFESASAGKTVNHKFTDSHWNMIGLPIFENQTGLETTKFTAADPSDEQLLKPLEADHGYFYEWDSINNAFGVKSTSGYVFKAMHGYMVQFTGDISFTGSSIQPASIVAARKAPQKEKYMIELEMLFNGSHTGRTYVELREEADEAFLLNEDVYMTPTARAADIFSFAGNYDVSANVLPIDNHIVPVGVEVHKAGMYTFTMPSNFSGTVELVDTFNGERTDLAMSDYSVYLEKGYQDGRFLLEINVNKVSTAIDGVSDGTLKDGKAHKFLQNGVMYILQNGVMYDAQGKRVK